MASVVTNVNCDFLIVRKEDYLNITHRFDKSRQAKLKFMMKAIPEIQCISSQAVLESLVYLLREAEYPKGHVIFAEGAPAKSIVFIQEGSCDIEKTLVYEEKKTNQKTETFTSRRKIANFTKGSCIGEEALAEQDPKYHYTTTVTIAKVILILIVFRSVQPMLSSASLTEYRSSLDSQKNAPKVL